MEGVSIGSDKEERPPVVRRGRYDGWREMTTTGYGSNKYVRGGGWKMK